MSKMRIYLPLVLGAALVFLSFSVWAGQAKKLEPLLGTWDVETEDGQYSFEFKFFLEDGELAGLFTGTSGEVKMEDLSFEDGKLSFTVNVDAGGQEMAIDFTATIDGDSLEGMLSLEFGEANITGTKRK